MNQILEWVDITNKLNVTKVEGFTMGIVSLNGPSKI